MVVIITGPTASGKTALSEQLISDLQGAIINADLGQFYTALTVGTAKPPWRKLPFDSYLFDWVDTPRDISVVAFKEAVDLLVQSIHQQQKVPIIVGGSSFYIKSIFYPPREIPMTQTVDMRQFEMLPADELWQKLHAVDVERARNIHPTDRYRLTRALALWHGTGQKPSTLKPSFAMPFEKAVVVIVLPKRTVLSERIHGRTMHMINEEGWVDEVRKLLGTSWEAFVRSKKLVGYVELIDWLNNGAAQATLSKVVDEISIKTRQYAKRQETFLKKLADDLVRDAQLMGADLQVLFVDDHSVQSVKKILALIKKQK